MKGRLIYYCLVTIPLFLFGACTDFQENDVPVSFGVDVDEMDFTIAPSTRSVTVSSGTKWDVSSMPSWVSLGAISQSGRSPYEWIANFSASANDEYNREGKIMIKAGSDAAEISVTQEGRKGKYIAVESVSVSPLELTLIEGESVTLSYAIKPSNATNKLVTWSSSNTSVATVSSSGVVTAKAAGSATITVTTNDGGKKATCSVTVPAGSIAVTYVSLDINSLTMKVGDTQTLTATVLPTNATNKSVTWSSNQTSVATVSSAGVVTAKSAGTAMISVVTNNGGYSATCFVTVINGLYDGAVDMGLPSGVKWASRNLGATKPEEYGDYYAWGEIEPYYSSLEPLIWKNGKEGGYDWSSYKWCMGTHTSMIKYCSVSGYGFNGFMDGKSVLDPEDDVAHVILGGNWRMPTIEEFEELIKYSIFAWTTINGVNGCIITSKITWNSIFLPAAGEFGDFDRPYPSAGRMCSYWSSSVDEHHLDCAMHWVFTAESSYKYTSERYRGLCIRPVCD